ncbi:MAG: mechanosensitive ion channel [Bacteroidaceae bacterium]|nr:mechanosensitive ion channel [Bacteroidaceae bacterium]MBQ2341128.1 mechanosensitive ion channel [Bacteroidaceae bacterium]MBQ6049866.1 mechanosensitive ion channel [Bacteroidaceae bacterium]MBR3547452.1 mechanosensitive ion channel [Bacteroidaceae bacterium]MBR6047094.1 mechanosensitive ion channel [Bacteroidaceae bacterium]
MIYLEGTETIQTGSEALKAFSSGKLDSFMDQAISLGVNAGKSILLAILIFVVGRYVIRLINKLIANMLERRRVEPTIQSFLKSFTNILLTILLVITVISALGVNTTSFAALLASAGVAIGMALSGNLQNLAGGIILLLFKPYKIGDYIEAQGVNGVVQEIQIFHTIILTVDNKQIYIPNGALSSGSITNYSAKELRRVDWTVGVEYGTDVEKVRAALMKLIDADNRILKDPAPFIALRELASSSVDFTVRGWVKGADYWGVFFDMNKQIYEEFNRQGISFPFPQIQVHQS